MLVFERKQDGAVNRNREATVSPSKHNNAHNKLREWTERAREGVIGLKYLLLMAPVKRC